MYVWTRFECKVMRNERASYRGIFSCSDPERVFVNKAEMAWSIHVLMHV